MSYQPGETDDHEQHEEAVVLNEVIETNERPLTSEEILADVDVRTEEFNENIINPAKRLSEAGITGTEADSLASTYDSIAGKIRNAYNTAGNMVRGAVLGGAIAMNAGPVMADQNELTDIANQLAAFAGAEEVHVELPTPPAFLQQASPEEKVMPQQEQQEEREGEEAPLRNDDIPEELRRVPAIPETEEAQGDRERQAHDDFRVAEHAAPAKTWEELREDNRTEKRSKFVMDAATTLMGQKEVSQFADEHGRLIAESLIPGAGIKQAFSGKDEYDEKLDPGERILRFIDGAVEIASHGGWKVAKKLIALMKLKSTAENIVDATKQFKNDPSVSSGANAISAIAGISKGGKEIGRVAGMIGTIADPKFEVLRSTISSIATDALAPPITTTPQKIAGGDPEQNN